MKFSIEIKPIVRKGRFISSVISEVTNRQAFCISKYGVHYDAYGHSENDYITAVQYHKVNKKVKQKKVKNTKKLSFRNKQTGEWFVPDYITKSEIIQNKGWVVEAFQIPKAVLDLLKLEVVNKRHKGGMNIKLEKRKR